MRTLLVGVLGVLVAGCSDTSATDRKGAAAAIPGQTDAARGPTGGGQVGRDAQSKPRDAGNIRDSSRGARADSGSTDAHLPREGSRGSHSPEDARDLTTTDARRDSSVHEEEAGHVPSSCLPVGLELVTSDLKNPVYATAPPGDDRIFVLERVSGTIVTVLGGAVRTLPFLDLSSRMSTTGFEAGLLGLAFPADFATTHTFFVSYTTPRALRVSRFQVPAGTPDAADLASESVVIEIPEVTGHNTSGMLLFGPDGNLFVATGDDDYEGNGQDLGTLKSKILRLDVSQDGKGYVVPATNPFVGSGNALPEIWAYGLREPYRFWFDQTAGDLYIADVGDSQQEEIDIAPAGVGGQNFGWPILEGSLCHTPSFDCDRTGLTLPAHEYPHAGPSAIIGGVLYRGTKLSACHRGRYFFGSYPDGTVTSLRWEGRATDVRVEPGAVDPHLVSFGQDGHGEILLLGYDRTLHRLVSRSE